MRKISLLLLVFGIMALARNAWAALSVEEQVKSLAQQYKQVEDQLARSVHYIRKTESGGATTIEQAWFNGANDLIKVAVERTDSSGRELTEYFTRDVDLSAEPMFVLTRKETPLPDGGTQVEESRKYFGENEHGNGQLIRELRKSARFKPGESLDTVHVRNEAVDVAKQSKDERMSDEQLKARSEFFSRPEKIASGLQATGPPEFDPFTKVKGDAEKFRVIHGTASPNGRYAIALGLAREEIDWDDFVEKGSPASAPTYYAEDEEDVRNYVVDLASQKILGETGCNFFGTRRRYNHRECTVTWSPDSTVFVQLWSDKWNYEACRAGKIAPGPKLAGVIDLGKEADKQAFAFLKKKRSGPEDIEELSLNIVEASNDGVIEAYVYRVDPTVPHRGETLFAVNERLRLRNAAKGPRLETLNISRAPVER
jgi:hypothetical protein